MALGIVLGDLDSAAKAFTDLKVELEKEKAIRVMAHGKVDTLTQAVKDLKISADKFAAQVPIIEEKVKHLESKVIDGLNEIRAKELDLEHTTKANDDYKKENAQLTRKLESKFPWSFKALFCS
jgi:chromosome segregation ATPase